MPTHQFDCLPTNHHYKLLAICTLVATVAFFDFMAFWYSTNTISSLFFSNKSDVTRHSFYMILIFGSGYLARPLGAILIGRYGDKKGRKPAILASMMGLTFFTLMIALLPTYKDIGVLATVLFVLSRIGQGITFGSQLPTLWVYITEQLPITIIGIACGIITAGTILSAVLLISLLGFLDTTLTQDELYSYGWRLPFFIGGIIGLILILLTKSLNETPIFLNKHTLASPKLTLRQRWQGFIPALILSWFVSSIVMVLVFFLTDLINLTFFIDNDLLAIAFIVCLVFLMVGSVFFGFLTDRFNGGKVIIIGSVFLLLSIFGLFYDLEQDGSLILLTFALTGFFAGVIGATPVIMVRLCPVRHRLSTLSISYNLSYALSGAFIPILLGFLTYYANFAPAVYLSLVCIITMFFGFYLYYSPRNKAEIEN